MRQIVICPICYGTTFNQSITCEDYTVSHETFPIIECTSCKFKLTSPLPENLDKYYQSPSYISHASRANSLLDRLYVFARTFTLQWKIRLVKRYQNKNSTSLLDYGCGTGDFLKSCENTGITISGVEPSEKARAIANEKTNGKIQHTIQDLPTQSFDAITLWHVLEHVPTLDETIQSLKNKLSESGTMFIAVPNHMSHDSSTYSEHWAGYDVPRHLWHFSQQTMEKLLTKNNLKLINKIPMKLDAYYISLMSEKNKNAGKLSIAGLLRAPIIALKSNLHAARSKEYSSIIYVIKK